MTRRFIGVRWWLGAAFAVVAATSTAIVVSQFSTRSENAFRSHAQQLADGSAFVAAQQVSAGASLRTAAVQQQLELLRYDAKGRLVGRASPGKTIVAHGLVVQARRVALGGGRFTASTQDGAIFAVGVPFKHGALVALSRRPDVAAAIGTVNDQALRAGVIAGVIGVLVGLLLAQAISLRLRRLTNAAEALAEGNFETPLRYRFRDEFGALAQSFERMRRQLRRSFRQVEGERDRLRLLLERLHEGVITVDANLVVRFANAEARRLLGRVDEGDELPEPWPGFSLRDFAQSLFDGNASLSQAHVRTESEMTLQLVGIPSQLESDNVLIVLDDLTEQERRELAEREFVTNAAHELRTPLTTIIGAVEVLQAGAKDDPAELDRFLAHIERESERLGRLARALLTLARAHALQEKPRLERVAVAPLLRDVAGELRPREGVTVDVECDDALTALVNRDLLEQAMRNLALNATQHTSSGRIVLRARADAQDIALEVEDTGVGMTADAQGHVFDRFYRGRDRDAGGFGLGLAIVLESVRALDGRIDLNSAPGKGTLVRIVLTRARVREAVPA